MQLRKSEYLPEKAFEIYTSFWKQYFQFHNPKGVKLLTTLRLGLSHLREHKVKHGFLDSLNPTCIAVKTLKLQLISFSTVLTIPIKN